VIHNTQKCPDLPTAWNLLYRVLFADCKRQIAFMLCIGDCRLGMCAMSFAFSVLLGFCAKSSFSSEQPVKSLRTHLWVRWPSIPNFSGPSRILRACPEKNTRSFGMLNFPEFWTVRNLSRFNVKMCQAWSSCSWSFWRFCLSEMCSVEDKIHQIHFRPGSAPDLAGGAYNAPSDLLVGWGGRCPLPNPHT